MLISVLLSAGWAILLCSGGSGAAAGPQWDEAAADGLLSQVADDDRGLLPLCGACTTRTPCDNDQRLVLSSLHPPDVDDCD